MTLGPSPTHEDLYESTRSFCEGRLAETSIYRLLARDGHRLFPDEAFADLFQDIGRRSVPPRIVAVVMVLQRLEGLSDREAVDRFTYDARWKYAAGSLSFSYAGFVHTVLVDMRARLSRSARPRRIFEAVLELAREAGLVGRKRVLDSTPLYDAVATQDTVTLIRSAIRALLRVADAALAASLRAVLTREDDYVAAGKPVCDWDDAPARAALVDALARDAFAVLAYLDGRTLSDEVNEAARLVATVVGQDLDTGPDGVFFIARRVTPDRVISTVDPETRHGHKTAARGFDGYKGHISIDPDSEIIVAVEVTPGNAGDGSVGATLLAEVLAPPSAGPTLAEPTPTAATALEPIEIFGDSAYGTAELVEHIEAAGACAEVKVQGPSAPAGMFGKDDFTIDLDAGTVRCPAAVLVQIRRNPAATDDAGLAAFGKACATCALLSQCTTSKDGRTIRINPRERTLQRSRQRQRTPEWRARYRAIRPKVERKLAHLMRRRHGGRCARVRGRVRVGHDFAMLAAAVNLRRLAVLGVRHAAGRPAPSPRARTGRHGRLAAVRGAAGRGAARSPAVSGPRLAAWPAAQPPHRRFSSTAPGPWRFTPAT